MFAPTRHLLPRPAFDVETEAPCGTSVAEAREALAFWRTRLRRLPWYRESVVPALASLSSLVSLVSLLLPGAPDW